MKVKLGGQLSNQDWKVRRVERKKVNLRSSTKLGRV